MLPPCEVRVATARRLKRIENIPQQDSAVNGLTKLTRTYAAQMEALKRYRWGGEWRLEPEAFTRREVRREDDLLDILVGCPIDIQVAWQPST